MSALNELYNYIADKCEGWGFDTWDHLPLDSENAKYPFVIVGEQQSTPSITKTSAGETCYITVHIWGSRHQQQKVDWMKERIASLTYNPAFRAEHYFFSGKPGLIDNQMMVDDTIANTLLWHGVITMAFILR